MTRLIAFLTDYGLADGFVAACHGVMADIAPAHRIVDITHAVRRFDVRHGAVLLAQTVPYLPPAVVVGVVDPGVGSARRIALTTPRHVFVGPDNGLLPWAADEVGGAEHVYELTDRRFWRESGAVTFDGRDVFAPVAAHIANGSDPGAVGVEISPEDMVRLPEPRRDVRAGSIATEALIVDHFGNVALAARTGDLREAGLGDARRLGIDVLGRRTIVRFARTFAEADDGELIVYVDAGGQVALAVNKGSASVELGLAAGDHVTLSSLR